MFEAKDYSNLLGTKGFSDDLLNTHFGLYQGYVKNTNDVQEKLKSLLKSDNTGPGEYTELKRRFGWEFNGMRLHELYFENLTKDNTELNKDSKLAELINSSFESFDNWLKDFIATGSMRGIGWVIMFHDKSTDKIFNVWVNEHDVGHLSGATPLLVMDVFEHAFIHDYGMKRADYIDSFVNAINWKITEERLNN
jgi:Fe-Mn family superoxide dismutase